MCRTQRKYEGLLNFDKAAQQTAVPPRILSVKCAGVHNKGVLKACGRAGIEKMMLMNCVKYCQFIYWHYGSPAE